MNKRKKRNLFLLLILVLFVSVGYAFLSTTLNINGTSKIKNATWNIYWDNPQVTSGSVTDTKPTIDTLKTTASFNITLEKPGDFYEFTIDAKNSGTIDGMISAISYKLNNVEISEENKLPAYLNYTVTYSDDVAINTNHLLAANTKETYKVRVEFKKDIENTDLPGEEVDLDLKFAVTYIQAGDGAVESHPTPSNPYLTRFDGNYIAYKWKGFDEEGYTKLGEYYHNYSGWFTELNPDANVYVRTDGNTPEICAVLTGGTVCITSERYVYYFNTDYDDCYLEANYDNTSETTCLKGYTKAKADEIDSKGGTCELLWSEGDPYLECSAYGIDGTIFLAPYGTVSIGDYSIDADGNSVRVMNDY